jgi:hypothetical protein
MINKNYGKIENGNIKFAKNPLWTQDKMIANPTNEMYIANGYKPIEYTDVPTKDGFYYTSKFIEVENSIVQIWEEHIVLDNIESI